jgi:hypothetical protein
VCPGARSRARGRSSKESGNALKAKGLRKMIPRFLRPACVYFVLTVVSPMVTLSCGLRRGDVQREWTDSLREFSINPIYPPREDVQLGDIYLRRGNPADPKLIPKSGFVPLDVLVGNVKVQDSVTGFYKGRSSFAKTSAPEGDIAKASVSPEGASSVAPGTLSRLKEKRADNGHSEGFIEVPISTSPGGTFLDSRIDSLRQVAFPDFSKMTIRDSNLQAFAPIEAVTLALGGQWRGTHEMQVKISSGESYAIPAATLLNQITEVKNGSLFLKRDATGIDPGYFKIFHESQKEWHRIRNGSQSEGSSLVYVDLITEVYYARSFDVSIIRQDSGGAGAEVRAIDAVIEDRLLNAAENARIRPREDTAAGDAPKESEKRPKSGYERAEEINNSLDDALSQRTVGGKTKFLYVSDTAVQMRRTYERPIAIGFRGITLGIDPTDGHLQAAGAVSPGRGAFTSTSVAIALQTNEAEFGAVLKDVLNRNDEISPKVERVVFSSTGERLGIRIVPLGAVAKPEDYRAKIEAVLRKPESHATLRAGLGQKGVEAKVTDAFLAPLGDGFDVRIE